MQADRGQLTSLEQRLWAEIGARAEAMLDDLATWVGIPTGWNHTTGLDDLRGRALDRVEALGGATDLIPGDPAPDWLWRGGRELEDEEITPPTTVCERRRTGPRILIACHLDTVFDPQGVFRELRRSADGATAVGPGVVDMKGGLLIAVNALEALEACGVDVSWTLLLNSDEETGSYHSAAALRAQATRHDIGICTEPALPGGELATERGGSGQFMLEARGRSAHVGREFEQGVSAVTALAEAMRRVAAMPDVASGRITSIGPLQGGDATNAVPHVAKAWGNARFQSPEMAEELGGMLDALATPEDAMPRLIVRRDFNRPAKPGIGATISLAEAAKRAAESLGQRLPFARTGGVCDGNILQDAGLPTIDTLGVRGGGLHTTEEWIDVSSLVERCRLFAVLLARLASGREQIETSGAAAHQAG